MSVEAGPGMSNRAIYSAALELTEPALRRAYLDEVCGDDVARRVQIEQLLAVREVAETNPLDKAIGQLGSAEISPSRTSCGKRWEPSSPPTIDRYKIREQIGEGGMGVVYVAEQTSPVRRKVALKIIKPGMNSQDVIARFEAERQALALMDHPNIARVLDAATMENGQPYFVMELVMGVPLTEFCDDNKLTNRARLELFIDVCSAVQHAHQKGIIHRDLKPSNIMVTMNDDKPIPKVIDFGIAKALSQPLTEHSIYTAYGQMIGTPLYMSPEQAQLNATDVDTRSDVYSLGVLLYELLTGSTPFDKEALQNSGFDEMRRVIREVDPPRPSQRVSTLKAEASSTVSGRRRVAPHVLTCSLAGELDWIVMKALEKDRVRRYESAMALAADLRRYLDGDLVQACPPSVGYRLRKHAQRHSVLLTTASLLVATLLVATGVSLAYAFQAYEARNDAVQARKEADDKKNAAVAAQELANMRLEQSRADFGRALRSLDTIVEEFSSPQFSQLPGAARIRDEVFAKTLKFYEEIVDEHDNDPHARQQQALAYARIGKILQNTGNQPQAVIAADRSIAILEALLAADPENGDYQLQLADALFKRTCTSGGLTRDESLRMAERALELQANAIESGASENFRELAFLHYWVAGQLSRDSPRARKLIEESVRIAREHDQSPHPGTIIWQARRAVEAEDYECAEKLFREGIQGYKVASGSVADRWMSHNELWWASKHLLEFGRLLAHLNRPDDAEAAYRNAVQITTELCLSYPQLPHYYQALKDCVATLASHLESQGRPQDAAAEAVSAYSRLIEQRPQASMYYRYRGAMYRERGEFELALSDLNKAIELVSNDGDVQAYQSRGTLLVKMKRYQKAAANYDEYVERSSHSAQAHFDRGEFYLTSLKNYKQAIIDFDFALEKSPGQGHWYKRRGLAHFHSSQYQHALADIAKALEVNPKDLSCLTWIDSELVANRRNEEFRAGMRALADRGVALNDRSVASLAARAQLLSAFGEWERVREDLDAVIAAGDAPSYPLYQASLLSVAGHDMPRYEKLCLKMLATFADSDVPSETHFTAWTCALIPGALENYAPAIKLARRAVEQEPENQQYLLGLGAILLRSGQYAEAKSELERALAANDSGDTTPVYLRYSLALTEHHLGNTGTARTQLRTANAMAEEELAGLPSWNRKLTLELLRSEAQTEIGKAGE